jgi:hypothetical protein
MSQSLGAHYFAVIRSNMEFTLRMVGEDLTQEQACFTLPCSTSNIAWILGHLAQTGDGFVGPLLGRSPELPPEYPTLFGIGSNPTAPDYKMPPLRVLKLRFRQVHEDLARRIEVMSDEELNAPVPDDHPARRMIAKTSDALAMLIYHMGYHAGQIAFLRRSQGLKGGMGV